MAAPNLAARTAQKVIALMKGRKEASANDIIKKLNVPRSTITSILKALYDTDQIHISGWIQYPTMPSVRIYSWGEGDDAEEPAKVFRPAEEAEVAGLPWPRCDVAASWVERRAA